MYFFKRVCNYLFHIPLVKIGNVWFLQYSDDASNIAAWELLTHNPVNDCTHRDFGGREKLNRLQFSFLKLILNLQVFQFSMSNLEAVGVFRNAVLTKAR